MAETQKLPVCDVRIATKGPRFFRGEDGGVLFEIQLDSRSKIGPRPMVEADKHQYPKAWDRFTTGEPSQAEPLKPLAKFVDHPQAKAEHDADKAERQRRMDAKRGGGR
jgi:hypothetical protein